MDQQCAFRLYDSPSSERFLPYSAEECHRIVYKGPSKTIEIAHSVPSPLTQLLLSVDFIQSAIEGGLYPKLASDSTGGVYFCYNQYEEVEAVFKPLEEEPYCACNPKSITPAQFCPSMDRGVTPGSGGLREVAAYYLDKGHFAGVPETVLASFPNTSFSCPAARVIGSLQSFVSHECSSEDYGPAMFSVDNVQRIALLDIRLLNMDRHVNNLLVTRASPCNYNDVRLCPSRASNYNDVRLCPSRASNYNDVRLCPSRASNPAYRSQSVTSGAAPSPLRLVPIDHGYALPRCGVTQVPEWCWMQWYQSKQGVGDAVREYVQSLDAESDVRLLQWYLPGIEEEALNTLRVTTLWLKLGVSSGLSLCEMGAFFYPRRADGKTCFQELVAMYERSGGCFVSFLTDVGSKYMSQQIRELRKSSSVLWRVDSIRK